MKLLEKRFRKVLEGRGEDGEDVMDVLTESFDSRELARICLAYLSATTKHQALSHTVVRWFFFALGLGLGLLICTVAFVVLV